MGSPRCAPVAFAIIVATVTPAAAQLQRASVASDGTQANGGSETAWISGDGRYVAFASSATNLAPEAPAGVTNLYLHDRATRVTTFVGSGSLPRVTSDGRYIVYWTRSGGTAAYDRRDGTTTTLLTGSLGTASDDLRYIAFGVRGEVCANNRIEIRDRQTGQTTTITSAAGDVTAILSPDGRYAAYRVCTDEGLLNKTVIVERSTSATVEISLFVPTAFSRDGRYLVSESGSVHDRVAGNTFKPDFYAVSAGVSPNGRFVAYEKVVYRGAGAFAQHTWVLDRQTGQSVLMSAGLGGVAASGRSYLSTVSNAGIVAFESIANNLVPADTNNVPDIFAGCSSVQAPCGSGDTDGDGLSDLWEDRFGLDLFSAGGSDGTDGDPDGDGLTNRQEFQGGTHPRGFFTRYFAEGATSAFFDAAIALANPGANAAHVQVRYLLNQPNPPNLDAHVFVPPMRRRTVRVKDNALMANAEFAAVIESDVQVIADRTMKWDASGYGSHAETSIAAPSATWYLAEGATHSGLNLFYLIQNPNLTPASVQIRYLLTAGAAPIVKNYTVDASNRFTIWVNQEGGVLASAEISAIITANQPVIVERAMYRDSGGRTFGAGHASAAIAEPATSWFFAEGATGAYFDLFILLANPTTTPAAVIATYLLPSGDTVVKHYTVGADSRFTIWVDQEDPRLADTAVSTTVTSTNGFGIIAERTMWWPGSAATWQETHASAGATATGARWAMADGELGGSAGTETYILVANTSSTVGSIRVTLLFEDGANAVRTFTLLANSRFNVSVAAEFPDASGRTFGALVESLGQNPAPIVVERANYSNAGGVVWAAGANALATRLP